MSTIVLSPPVRNGLAVGVGVGVSGFAFGSAGVTAGLSVAQTCVLSLAAFTGASQFAFAGVFASGGSLLAGTAGALLLGARNTLYGLRLADHLAWRGSKRALAAHGVIDETAAVSIGYRTRGEARLAFLTTAVTLYILWNATTFAGALATGQVTDPAALGLDAVGPAVFLALIWPRLQDGGRERVVALLAVIIAIATVPLLPAGLPVLLAAAATFAVFLMRGAGS